MSITAQTARTGPYVMAAFPQACPTGFAFQQSSDLLVINAGQVLAPRDPAAVLVLGSDYTVTGGGYLPSNQMQGGTVTIQSGGASSCVAGDVIWILRNVPENQIASATSAPLTPILLEESLDKSATIAQQQQEQINRCLQFENFETFSGVLSLGARKGNVLGFDATGAPAYVPSTSLSGQVTPPASISALKALSVGGFANNMLVQVLGYYSIGDGGGGSFYFSSSSVAADNGGSVIAPNVGTGRWLRLVAGPCDVRFFGAKGDNVNDDTVAIRNALIAFRDVYLSAGTYLVSAVIDINSGNSLTGSGSLSIINFVPATAPDDRCLRIDSTISALRGIAGSAPIAIGATSFTAANAGLAADLVAGDWISVEETDHPTAAPDDICNIDWVQVASVASATITLQNPFRTAFLGTHNTYGFRRISPLIQNTRLANFRVNATSTAGNTPLCIDIHNTRHCLVDNVIVSSPYKGFFCYRSSEVTLRDCKQVLGQSEIAAVTDLKVRGCLFGTEGAVNITSALTLDMGCAFFTVTENTIYNAGNIMVQLLYGLHDGVFSDNVLSYVTSPSANLGNGIIAQGCQRVVFADNVLTGGKLNGTGNAGIATSDTSTFTVNISSTGNIIHDNSVVNYTTPYSIAAADTLSVGTATTVSSTIAAGSAVSLATGVPSNVTSISLPAGEWTICPYVFFQPAASTTISWIGGITGSTSAEGVTLGQRGTLALSSYIAAANPSTVDFGLSLPNYRVKLTAAITTYYLIGEASFATSTLKCYGTISAIPR